MYCLGRVGNLSGIQCFINYTKCLNEVVFISPFMVLKSTSFIPIEKFLHLGDLILSDILRNSASLFCVNDKEI